MLATLSSSGKFQSSNSGCRCSGAAGRRPCVIHENAAKHCAVVLSLHVHIFSADSENLMGALASRISNGVLGKMACLPPQHASYDLRGTMFTLCESVRREGVGEQTTTCKLAMRWYIHSTGGILNTSNRQMIENSNSQITILFSHGNAVDAGQCHEYCSELAALSGCNVVIWDYHSYGLSDKHAFCEQNLYRGIKAVLTTISEYVPTHSIFLFGKSLGSVPTIWLAAQCDTMCSGVILMSPLASGARTFCNLNGMPSTITHWMDGMFADSIERVCMIRRPVMIVHGTEDEIVPVQNALDLYAQLPEIDECDGLNKDVYSNMCLSGRTIIGSKNTCGRHRLLLLTAGHNDIEILYGSQYICELLQFVHSNVTSDSDI